MNWSTRLRRWVRIRTPPVREPSTKPSAATVLPEPVACSNQKRRLAPGPRAPRPPARRPAPPSPGAPPRLAPAPRPPRRPLRPPRSRRRPRARRRPADRRRRRQPRPGATRSVPALGGDRVLELGGQRREGPGEHVDLVLGELGPVRQQHRLGGEQPLEPEQQRVAAPPLGRGGLAAGVELRQGSLDGAAPRGPGSDVVDRLAVEQDRLARELAHALELIACDRAGRALCDVDGFRHEKKFSGAPRSCGWWRGRCKLAGGSPARSWLSPLDESAVSPAVQMRCGPST